MRGADLTAVISWLEAGCDPAEAAKELRSYQEVLSSQSLSLSEAREEIERYRGLAKQLSGALLIVRPLGGSELFRRFNDDEFYADPDVCGQMIVDMKKEIRERKVAAIRARAALGPRPCDCERCDCGNIGDAQEVARWDERAATLDAAPALENGPAGLADATSNPPLSDLSSLRKGAEVVEPEIHQRIRAFFLHHIGATRTECAAAIGVDRRTVWKHLKRMQGHPMTASKLVPVEPTAEMRRAGERAWMNRDLSRADSDPISDCYRAMVDAALVSGSREDGA